MLAIKYAIVIVTYNREQLLRECVYKAENQTIAPSNIIIVNNASTDGTPDYLEELKKRSKIFDIINLSQNIGGAGGFAKGLEHALEKDVDCVLIIDDDAIIARDYMGQILQARHHQPQYGAFAGVIKTNGHIDLTHRRNLYPIGLLSKNCKEQDYRQPYFVCDIASFCGMVVDMSILRQIGLPHAEYFIWYDDTEYSLRIHRHSKFLVVTAAELNHKTKQEAATRPRRYEWKDYYAVRNRLLMVREHGSFIDRAINFCDLFLHMIFRNWLFGVFRIDSYDWKYERRLIRDALRDADKLKNGKHNNLKNRLHLR